MKTAISFILFTFCAVVVLALPARAFADGDVVTKSTKTVCNTTTSQYGSTSKECHDETTETVTHKPVGAGVGDVNFITLAGIFGSAAAVFFLLSRSTRRIFLFER